MIFSENLLLCIAVPLAIAIPFLRGNTRRFPVCFLLGLGVCLLSAYISGFFNMAFAMDGRDTAIYISPVIEEIMKLLPLIFYMFVFLPGDEELLHSAIAIGVGFATFENCCYLLTMGTESLSFTMIRGFAVGVMHVVSILFVTFGLVLERRFHSLSAPEVIGALALSTAFHGLYKLLVSQPGIPSYIGYGLPLVTAALLYFLFRKLRGFSA